MKRTDFTSLRRKVVRKGRIWKYIQVRKINVSKNGKGRMMKTGF